MRPPLKAILAMAVVVSIAACGDSAEEPKAAASEPQQASAHGTSKPKQDEVVAAMLAAAAYQDVAMAEEAGYASTLDTLGCFVDAELGGMGVHYLDESLLDAELDVAEPEALVYELDATGQVVGLVGHEYIVPVEAWTSKKPPRLFDTDLHRHPTLLSGCCTRGSGRTIRPGCTPTGTPRCGHAPRGFRCSGSIGPERHRSLVPETGPVRADGPGHLRFPLDSDCGTVIT